MFTQIQTSAAVEIIPVTEIELPAQTLLDRTSVRANMVTTGMERHALRQVSGGYCRSVEKT